MWIAKLKKSYRWTKSNKSIWRNSFVCVLGYINTKWITCTNMKWGKIETQSIVHIANFNINILRHLLRPLSLCRPLYKFKSSKVLIRSKNCCWKFITVLNRIHYFFTIICTQSVCLVLCIGNEWLANVYRVKEKSNSFSAGQNQIQKRERFLLRSVTFSWWSVYPFMHASWCYIMLLVYEAVER